MPSIWPYETDRVKKIIRKKQLALEEGEIVIT
jgi:hypothetical protein